MQKRSFNKYFLTMTMFLFLIVVGGCGGGGGSDRAIIPPLPSHLLSSIQLSSGALSPAFNPTTTQYTVSVANSVASINITPRTASANASILVNGVEIASGNTQAVNLNVGQNTIEITVENSDGSTTYTVIVTRESMGSALSPTLSSLQFSSGAISPDFSPTITEYTANVAYSVTSVNVATTTAFANALISINGSNATGRTINLNEGTNAITIIVGNYDGSTTYTLTITRAGQPIYKKITAEEAREMMTQSSNYVLLDVRTEAEYRGSRIEDAILIPYDEIVNRALAELPDKDQLILVYCQTGFRSEIAARALVDLGYSNVYDFGGIVDWSYGTKRAPALSNLQLSSGALSPAFSPSTLLYSASAANALTSVTVTPTTSANASITVNGAGVSSGSASGAINLNVGANTITIIVENSDGSTTYALTVTRVAGSLPPTLTGIQISTGGLTPAFGPVTTLYSVSVANFVPSIFITPTTSANALITVNGVNTPSGNASGAIDLNVGANIITIIVGNSDGSTTYILTATRASPPNTGYWTDLADTSWWDAASNDSSFTISTPQQLAGFVTLISERKTDFSGVTITLSNSINLAGREWQMIVGSFRGVFDGAGHEISNMKIYSNYGDVGLFESLESTGTIKNIKLTNVEIEIHPG